MELTYLATERMQLGLNMGTSDTKYFNIQPGAQITENTEFGGSPDKTIDTYFQYGWMLGNRGMLSARFAANYWGSYWRSNIPSFREDAYGGNTQSGDFWTTSARLAYTPAGRQVRGVVLGEQPQQRLQHQLGVHGQHLAVRLRRRRRAARSGRFAQDAVLGRETFGKVPGNGEPKLAVAELPNTTSRLRSISVDHDVLARGRCIAALQRLIRHAREGVAGQEAAGAYPSSIEVLGRLRGDGLALALTLGDEHLDARTDFDERVVARRRTAVFPGSPSSGTMRVFASDSESIFSCAAIVPASEPPEDMSKNG